MSAGLRLHFEELTGDHNEFPACVASLSGWPAVAPRLLGVEKAFVLLLLSSRQLLLQCLPLGSQ